MILRKVVVLFLISLTASASWLRVEKTTPIADKPYMVVVTYLYHGLVDCHVTESYLQFYVSVVYNLQYAKPIIYSCISNTSESHFKTVEWMVNTYADRELRDFS